MLRCQYTWIEIGCVVWPCPKAKIVKGCSTYKQSAVSCETRHDDFAYECIFKWHSWSCIWLYEPKVERNWEMPDHATDHSRCLTVHDTAAHSRAHSYTNGRGCHAWCRPKAASDISMLGHLLKTSPVPPLMRLMDLVIHSQCESVTVCLTEAWKVPQVHEGTVQAGDNSDRSQGQMLHDELERLRSVDCFNHKTSPEWTKFEAVTFKGLFLNLTK